MGNMAIDENGNIINSQTGQIVVKAQKVEEKPLEQDSNQKTPVPPPRTYTKYEVKPESHFIVKFGIMEQDGRIIVTDEDMLESRIEKHWVKFRMWTYAEELDIKSKATEFDSTKKVHLLNNDKLNEIKIRTLIQDWSFSQSDASLKLLHINNYLSDEGLKIVYSLYPTIIRYIINRMNEVLEFNG